MKAKNLACYVAAACCAMMSVSCAHTLFNKVIASWGWRGISYATTLALGNT